MGDLSLFFHIASTVVLFGLILWVLRLQLIVSVWRRWSLPHSERTILVGEPFRVLRQLSCALDADFDVDQEAKHLAPQKMNLTEIFQLHRAGRICGIFISAQREPTVEFVLELEPSILNVDSAKIARELGDRFKVVVRLKSQHANRESK